MPRHIQGITLVELMIAIAISTILMAGVATVYTANRKGSNLNTGIARIQENLRFVGEIIAQDVRMAGYVGCRGLSLTNTLNTPTLPQLDIDTPVRGYEGDSSTSSFPTEITSGSNPLQQQAIVGSDALIVLRGSSTEFTIENHNSNAATFILNASPTGVLEEGDVVMATDCWHSAVFQVSSPITGSSKSVVHNTGGATSPGNCWKRLGPPSDPPDSCGGGGGNLYTYNSDARILKMQATLYYVATSVSGQTTSLYSLGMDKGALSVREELVEGVESMQVLYGYDTNDDDIANRFVDAGWITGSGDWDNVVSVRIGFLVATPNEVRSVDDTRAYTVAGTPIDDSATTVTHAADKKMRFAYTMTVKLRNKGVM